MGLLDFLKKENKNKGLLGYLELLDWFNSLNKNEQQKILKYSGYDETDLFETEFEYTTDNRDSFYANIVRNALTDRDLDFAIKYLNKLNTGNWSVDDQHFFYQSLLPLFYRMRDENREALDLIIIYSQKNAQLIKNHKEELLDYFESQPHFEREFPAIDCFSYLCKIYEKQGKFADAIQVCQDAINLGIMIDGNRTSYENRLERLKKKIDKG